jgi:hypothetical protein
MIIFKTTNLIVQNSFRWYYTCQISYKKSLKYLSSKKTKYELVVDYTYIKVVCNIDNLVTNMILIHILYLFAVLIFLMNCSIIYNVTIQFHFQYIVLYNLSVISIISCILNI